MNTQLLGELISREEDVDLEFKQSVDLESKEGKAKFLREMLALANSVDDHSCLILGVEDKTRKLVGIKNVTEEQVQQVVSGECRPPIFFSFEIVQYRGVSIGVIQIRNSHFKPHMLKKKLGYSDSNNGKPQEIRESQIFVRHGSVIDEATREELIQMIQDRGDALEFGELAYPLERIDSTLQDVASSLDYMNERHKFPDRLLEGAFVGTVLGILIGWLGAVGWSNVPVTAVITGPIVALVLSVMRFVQYAFLRALITGILVGLTLALIFGLSSNWLFSSGFFAGPELLMWIVYGAVTGIASGVIGAAWVGSLEKNLFRR